ncbi:hypothetical protein EFK68_04775 [Pseudomonas aeruginosa]|nr:hypothetical protein EFK68_04775 [Pseudomonas aeruginosa]
MNVLNLVWPGFSAARRIARNPIRFLVAGLEACIMFPLEHAPWGFRILAGLVMVALVFGCGAAALPGHLRSLPWRTLLTPDRQLPDLLCWGCCT